MQFVAFPQRKDAILQNNNNIVNVESSGSLGMYINDVCVKTKPNQTLNEDKKQDWCSNIATDSNNMPWITFSLKGKSMKINGFSLRNGCCWYYCCCDETGTIFDDIYCCCELYSFSLLGSNDNKTWKTIYKVEAETKFYHCLYKTYEFPMTQSYKYIRLYQDEEYPRCPKCLQINQIEFYGETVQSPYDFTEDLSEENDESISIIGRINRNSM